MVLFLVIKTKDKYFKLKKLGKVHFFFVFVI